MRHKCERGGHVEGQTHGPHAPPSTFLVSEQKTDLCNYFNNNDSNKGMFVSRDISK